MTGRRNTIIAVGAIVLFTAIVGFFITLDVSPQIAYARLFIDVGLIIGLVAVISAFYKEAPLQTAGIVHALGELAHNKLQTRLTTCEGEPLFEVTSAVNELAKAMEAAHNKQEEIKQGLREELLPRLKEKKPLKLEHSIHPELGPVLAIEPMPASELLNNTLVESHPPSDEAPRLPNPIDAQDQDLGELYQNFIRAQEEVNATKIEYTNFLKSVEKTRQGILQNHQCVGVIFDVVKEDDQVALQPRLIREQRA